MITLEDIENMKVTIHIIEKKNIRAYADVELDKFIVIKSFIIAEDKMGRLTVINPSYVTFYKHQDTGMIERQVNGGVMLLEHELRVPLIKKILTEYGKHFENRFLDNRETLEEMNYEYTPKKILDF